MGEFPYFQVNDQKAFQYVIVEDQIGIKMVIFSTDFVLSAYKSKAFAQF